MADMSISLLSTRADDFRYEKEESAESASDCYEFYLGTYFSTASKS